MRGGRLVIAICTSALIVGFLAISFINFYYRSEIVLGKAIAQDIKKLAEAFDKIDAACRIISFDEQQNPINFLNIKEFSSSEVGPINLAYPKKWAGPYICDNPEVQGKSYMVVRTHNGYFVTPGNGVKLPNGLVIGKDITFGEKADIKRMVREGVLQYKGMPLALQIAVGSSMEPSAVWKIAH